MDESEYRQPLLEKLAEEAQEARNASMVDLITELADVLEVVDTIIEANGISIEDVRRVQAAHRRGRGGFEK